MAPHKEDTNGPAASEPTNVVPNELGITKANAMSQLIKFPTAPKFDDPYKERGYYKGRLAAAFRIFGKYGFDEGVAGHITYRVCIVLDLAFEPCPDLLM
jgi:hypothetical protein